MKTLLNKIYGAFENKTLPEKLYDYSDNIVDDLDNILPLQNIKWQDVDYDTIYNLSECIIVLTDEAMCYYVPSLMKYSLELVLANQQEFFASYVIFIFSYPETIHRLKPYFNPEQLEVIKEWLNWVKSHDPHNILINQEKCDHAIKNIDTYLL